MQFLQLALISTIYENNSELISENVAKLIPQFNQISVQYC